MSEPTVVDDPLTRIQREIIEVTEREKEFREGHYRVNRLMSESNIQEYHNGNGHVNGDSAKVLNRAVSTSHLHTNNTISNGYTRRFTPQSGQRGIMQRFIASKGKLSLSPMNSPSSVVMQPTLSPAIITSPTLDYPRLPEGKPIRKGYVPVEEKIQKELKEMKDREHELKTMRKKQKPFDFGVPELSDNEPSSDSDDEDIPMPGKLKATKSIGELYEALNYELRSPSPKNHSSHDSLGVIKPAKSLAELCALNPGEQFLAPSSTKLIAQWESIIQQKQEAGAA